jgi:lysophospholipase L1-like esterase
MFLHIVLSLLIAGAAPGQHEGKIYDKDIAAFEAKDKVNPPAQGGLLFVGSSTIRMWDVSKFFPDLKPLNRGFGGSQFSDIREYVDRVIVAYHPKTIVLYAGDNDIAHDKTPEQTFADFKSVIDAIHAELKDVRVLALSIKPSVARWDKYDKMKQVNKGMAELADKDPQVEYVELGAPLLDADGRPNPEFYMEDGLHLNDKGYGIWAEILRPLLTQKP